MSRSTGILCDWLNNSDKRYSPIRVFPQQLFNRQIGSSSNIKIRVQEGFNELGIVLLCEPLCFPLCQLCQFFIGEERVKPNNKFQPMQLQVLFTGMIQKSVSFRTVSNSGMVHLFLYCICIKETVTTWVGIIYQVCPLFNK